MATMKAAVVAGPQRFEIKDVPVPEIEPDGVLVRVRNCGICGSDLHFFRGEFPSAPGLRLGHEISGEVAAFGEHVTGLSEGQPVAIEPVLVCRTCELCTSGRSQLCPNRKLLGTVLPGGLAEYVHLPSYLVYPLPDDIDFEVGALVEPLAVTVHGLRQVNLEAGERVAIVGAGTVGLMAVIAAQSMGASDVFISARYSHQAEAAKELGANVIEANESSTEAFATAFAGRPPEVAIETVGGQNDTLNEAVTIVAPGGRISILGLFTKAVRLNATAAVLKEALLVGSMTYGRPGPRSDFEVALDIAASRAEELRSVITHRVSLDEIAQGFEIAADKTQRSIKVTVEV
ncbi:MAG: alcohol dehydrogenase catalytic domain-containing protein [Chloroflexi bacterium]|nr:alcohol dehydrogenase catalytic domain-containing protein [Chloroflexota bacterium]